MSKHSKRGTRTIRSLKSFRPGAFKNAMAVDKQFCDLVRQKKNEIGSLIKDLYLSKVISYSRVVRFSSRATYFEIDVGGKIIELRFIIWTDTKEKDSDIVCSQFAKFVLRSTESIEDVRIKVLRYLEGIDRGCATEYLSALAHEELQKEKVIHYFYKTGRGKDIRGADFVNLVFKDGLKVEVPDQAKSSYEELMKHKEEHPEIPGYFREFTGDFEEEKNIIKEKIIRIINAFKRGEIIFI